VAGRVELRRYYAVNSFLEVREQGGSRERGSGVGCLERTKSGY
jgi:hypothetical protein